MGENRLVVELFFEKPTFEEVSKIAKSLEEVGVKTLLLPPEDRHINTHLIVECSDIEKTRVKLVELGVPVKEKEAVLIQMQNKPGTMAEAVKKISEKGINLTYAFSVTMDSEISYLLLAATDNRSILDVLPSN
ncbi:hypothetical protein KKB44_03410 [Candidatus Micrarchaeota archaeon]|nr:hypothetical protein [Candidatus Micrarchaeota archaeon]